MAIPNDIETALADKPQVLEFVKGLDAKAEKFTPEIEKALPDLAKLPELQTSAAALAKILGDTKAENADKLLTDFNNLKTINADLTRQRDAWKASGKAGDVTQTPEYKAIEEKLANATKDFDTRFKTLEDQSKADKEEKVKAVTSQRETDLKSSLISAAAANKIRNPEDEYLLLKAKGLIGHKDDGTPFFNKLNEKGEKVAVANAAELAKWIADTDKSKVDPSSKTGTGQQHQGGGAGGNEAPKSASEARRGFFS